MNFNLGEKSPKNKTSMKRIFSYAMAAAIAFGLASCSKDVNIGGGEEGADGLAATFTIQTPKGAFLTYADPIAEGAEWTVNNIDIYAFNNTTGTMIGTDKLIKDTDYKVTSAAGAATTTIKVENSWLSQNVGDDVVFYFVGNDDDTTPANGAIKAPHVVVAGNSAIAAWESQVTVPLAVDATPKISELIRTPLLFSTKSEVITIKGRQQAKATLTRREARFDIVNAYAAETTPLVVNAIQITNAPRAGKIFADGGANTISWASIDGALYTMPIYNSTISNGKYGDYWKEVNAKGEDVYRAKSVFYLYPTVLGEAAAHTQIVIEATMNGVTEYYTRAVKDVNGVAIPEPEINANFRYTLVLNPLSLTFDVVTADYDEGGEIDTEAGGDDLFSGFTIAGTAAASANWKAATQVYTFDGTTNEQFDITFNSQFGSAFKVETTIGDDTQITNYGINGAGLVTKGSPVVTYGRNIADTYTVKTPLTASTDTYSIRVTIYSPNGKAKETILFQKGTMDTGAIADVVNGNTELAQAIEDAIKAGNGGVDVTPEDIEKITTIDVSGPTGPSSLDGIGNLPNLTEINATGNTNITEVDLSNNPALEKVHLNGTGITKIDLSNNPNLKDVNLRDTGISNIDLSNNPNLESLVVSKCPNITEIDLSNNPELTTLSVAGTSVSEIDLKNNTKIEILYIGQSKIKEVDLSMCAALSHLDAQESEISELDLRNTKVMKLYLQNSLAVKVSVKMPWTAWPSGFILNEKDSNVELIWSI